MPTQNKYPTIYAFIDSQNLNLGTSKDLYDKKGNRVYVGWKLDYQKFRLYLTNKFRVTRAFFFIGYVASNAGLYTKLKTLGYDVVLKPTVKDAAGKPKGNVDAELVLHSAAIEYLNYDKAMVVSGDGDFYCLYDYLEQKGKLGGIIIPNTNSESSLLRKFGTYKTFIMYDKGKLEL